MTLDTMHADIAAVRARAVPVQRDFAATKTAIIADINLSLDGKDAAIREARARAKAQMDALQAEEARIVAAKHASLQRSTADVVGTDSGSIITYRDAQDRADRLTSAEEASRIMTRALTNGDRTLASAVATAALGHGWRSVYDTWAAKNPTASAAMRDLAELENGMQQIGTVLGRAMAYSV